MRIHPRFTVSILALLFQTAIAFTPYHRGENRFFLDTADTAEWDSLLPLGMFYGVTTNPTILQQCNQPCTVENLLHLAKRALSHTEEFMCQTWGSTAEEMYSTGMALSQPDRDRIVIKVPITMMGVEAVHLLHQSGVRTCLTAAFDAKQALVAASVGSEYIAPYCGRIEDAGEDGEEECLKMLDIVEGLKGETRILVASLRSVDSICRLAEEGIDTFTFSPTIARSMFDVPLTEKAAAEFEEAASNEL